MSLNIWGISWNEGEKNMSFSDNYCFACGKENPIGLKLDFVVQDDNMWQGRFWPRSTRAMMALRTAGY
jgi:hypothetical protein